MLKLFGIYITIASLFAIFFIIKNIRFLFWKKTEGEIIELYPQRIKEIIRYESFKPVVKYRYK